MGFIPLVVVRSCAVKWISQELSRCQSSGVSLRMLRRTQVQRSLSTDSSPAAQPAHGHEPEEEQVMTGVVKRRLEVACPEDAKLMKISIIGLPNAGKSTVINALTNFKVCPVSRRPHTTRGNQKAVHIDQNTQLVFVDTPGLVSVKEIRKFKFNDRFVHGPEASFSTAHVIAVVHDVSNAITRDKLDFRTKAILEKFPDKRSILILNKIDRVKMKRTLLDTIKYLTCGIVNGRPIVRFEPRSKQSHLPLDKEAILKKAKEKYDHVQILKTLTTFEDKMAQKAQLLFSEYEIQKGIDKLGWPKFHDIFMISALEGDGIDLLREYLITNAAPEKWLYDSDTLTDLAPGALAIEILKAKLLDHLPQEIPFKVKPYLECYDDSPELDEVQVHIRIRCANPRYVWKIRGIEGALLAKITRETLEVLHSLVCRPVKLNIEPVHDKTLQIE